MNCSLRFQFLSYIVTIKSEFYVSKESCTVLFGKSYRLVPSNDVTELLKIIAVLTLLSFSVFDITYNQSDYRGFNHLRTVFRFSKMRNSRFCVHIMEKFIYLAVATSQINLPMHYSDDKATMSITARASFEF